MKRTLSFVLTFLVVLTKCHSSGRVQNEPYKVEARIVSGEEAEKHEFPWMAMISDKLLLLQGCGATLIHKRFVLTAGHCLRGQPTEKPRIIRVRFGMHNYTWRDDDPDVVSSSVRRIIMHPQYVPNHVHDFALIELDEDVNITDNIRPICLPPMDQDFTDEMATVIGWGKTAHNEPVSHVLRKADVPVIDQDYCRDLFDPSPILDDMLCAGRNGKDACQYDSGGPLMWKNRSGTWHLIGVVSWGRGCGSVLFPGVYARVSSVLPWIESVIGKDHC